MKAICKKISEVMKMIFGYGIMIVLFAGGMTFFGYVAALCIGGDIAAAICAFISKTFMTYVIYASTGLVLFGLLAMYLGGEQALTSNKKKAVKHKGET